MAAVILFYFFLLAFWLETVFGFKLTAITGLSLLNVAFYFLFIVWVIVGLRKRRFIEHNKVNFSLLLLFVLIVASIPVKFILDEVPDINLFDEIVYLKSWLNPVLVFFILFNILNNQEDCQKVITALLVFLAVTVFSTIAVSMGLLHFGLLSIDKARTAGFIEPNQYAALLVLFIPLIYSKVLFSSVNRDKIVFSLFLFFVLVSLVITGSRGGVIAGLFASLVYFNMLSRRQMIKLGTVVLVLIIALPILGLSAFFVAPPHVRDEVMERFDPTSGKDANEMTSGRKTIWENGIKLFIQSPVYGHGQATFLPLNSQYYHLAKRSHNDYLTYLVQYGIIGLMLFLYVYWKLLREVLLIVSKSLDKHMKVLALSYIAGFSGYAIAMFSVNINQPRYLFWAYSAVILRYGYLNIKKQIKNE